LYSYSQNTCEYMDFPTSTHGNTRASGEYGLWENHEYSYLCYFLAAVVYCVSFLLSLIPWCHHTLTLLPLIPCPPTPQPLNPCLPLNSNLSLKPYLPIIKPSSHPLSHSYHSLIVRLYNITCSRGHSLTMMLVDNNWMYKF
jgi:hypothetical protein